MFEKLGIDTLKVLEAAKKKYNFQIHYPGAGVGGPCLPINSYQLLNAARRSGVNLSMIEYGRQINEKMPEHVIKLTLDAFKECKKPIQNNDILILGVSYKPDVKDIQLTPAKHIIEKLQKLGANVHIYDPYFTSTKIFGIDTLTTIPDENILKTMNAAVIVTGHDSFKSFKISNFSLMKNPILIDTRGIFEPRDAKDANLIFRGLGRGD
jgi:nucleotide sugar dehydrogenase